MIITLENSHRIIKEVLQNRFNERKSAPLNLNCRDFDGSNYEMTFNKESGLFTLSVQLRPEIRPVLKEYGMSKILEETYGAYYCATPKDGFDVTLQFSNVNETEQKQILESFPLVKRYIMMAPVVAAFDKFEQGQRIPKPICIPYRENESMYLCFEKDSLVVTFSLRFKDKDDITLAEVFMQEFADAKMGGAPSVSYTRSKKPLELKDVNEREDDSTGFVSMVLFKRHVEKAKRIDSIDALLNFRAYFHYHLKCSKAYMHMRMRTRVAALLDVLNQAKFEKATAVKAKKTASGRFFQRN